MTRTLGLKGLDVSKYQTSLPDLSGQSFIVLRSSIALTKDTLYDQHYAKARAAGLVVMAYHYAYPQADADIAAQAALFLATAKDADFLWLDQEQAGFDDVQAQKFVDIIRKSRPCGLYHSASGFGGVKADAQWVADYRDASVTAGFPRNTATGAELAGWDLWQWTSKGSLPGYTGNLDLNWMNPASRLASLLRTGYVTKAQLDAANTATAAMASLKDEALAQVATLTTDLDAAKDALEAAQSALALVESDRAIARRLLGL